MARQGGLPRKILGAAANGDEGEIVTWLEQGGQVDALYGESFSMTMLMRAASDGHTSIVGLLLQRKASIDLQQDCGVTALMLAASHGQTATVQLLLDAGANSSLCCDGGNTALQFAEIAKHEATASLLRRHAATEPSASSAQSSEVAAALPLAVFNAARESKGLAVAWLAQSGQVNARCAEAASASLLTGAAFGGQTSLVQLLLQRKASIDQQADNGFTALMAAACKGLSATVLVLLKAGADASLRSASGQTALELAEGQEDYAAASVLRRHAANPAYGSIALPNAIVQAARKGKEREVATWLKQGGQVDACFRLTTGNSVTLLMLVALSGRASLVRLLLQRKASVDLQDDSGSTALMYAAGEGHVALVQALLDAGADASLRSNGGNTALQFAEHKQHEATAALLRKHAATRASKVAAELPEAVINAVAAGKEDEVVAWLEQGGQVDARCAEQDSMTLLMLAAALGHTSVVRLLLQRKAVIDLQDDDGVTALMTAAGRGHTAVAQVLLDAGADSSLPSNDGQTALQFAEDGDQEATASLLRVHDSSAHSFDVSTALPNAIIEAAGLGKESVVVRWLEQGGQVDALCAEAPKSTLLILVAIKGDTSLVRLLLQRKASVDLQGEAGSTALMHAACKGHTATAQALLEAGADPSLRCNEGYTALQFAEHKQQEATVSMLRRHAAKLAKAKPPTAEEAAAAALAAATADKAAAELLAEEEAEAEAKRSKAKTKKGKARVKLPSDDSARPSIYQPAGAVGEAPASAAEVDVAGAAVRAADDNSEAADRALRGAMRTAEYEALAAALGAHGAEASEPVRAEARALRDKLREKRKKQSQKQKRAHAGAMEALAALQTARAGSDAHVLRLALTQAESHAAELPEALDQERSAALARLSALTLDSAPAAAPAEAPTAVLLAVDEVKAATCDFDGSRVIGSGGFGKVFRADAMPSLPLERWPAALGQSGLAVKRANQGLAISDLQTEIEILKVAGHPHLLPLFGYCLDTAASCLIFPLMAGGSLQARLDLTKLTILPTLASYQTYRLQARLDLAPKDVATLLAMGHFRAAPKPLTWRQKLRAVLQATEALLYLHTPDARKPRTLHRDFKPANILLGPSLHAYLGDTGFAKAAHRSWCQNGAGPL